MEKYLSGVKIESPQYGGAGNYFLVALNMYFDSEKGDFGIEENPPELFEDIEILRPKRISTIKTESDLVFDEIYRGITDKVARDDYIPKEEKELIFREEIQAFV
ncbi:MAG: hypothetical protein NTY20_00395 [Candidatus Aenigmarchaeota archaeon]|nr:hypothetical protein [Candidatus Aenigmarchaeota archaeon]